eukprot:TRINITY_DN29413_c0_g1_i1.p1 TRINITY_DN29413_c0_g1~~TRINITY_DN29413_c0_g1_i1.p1  ORF type:complete len:120 (-),score=28.86 TRINITY_DN29413_c0_g1_i1:44-403(-)
MRRFLAGGFNAIKDKLSGRAIPTPEAAKIKYPQATAKELRKKRAAVVDAHNYLTANNIAFKNPEFQIWKKSLADTNPANWRAFFVPEGSDLFFLVSGSLAFYAVGTLVAQKELEKEEEK